MKKTVYLICILLLAKISFAQNIGIGTSTPNASAILDINSTAKGLLIPRMTNTQMNAIASPAPGLLVFNLTDSLMYVRKNSGWAKLGSNNNGWTVNGNDLYNNNTGNVGIGTSSPSHARVEVNGSVGAAVAIFGADKYGVAIEADNPEIGFNYFYNNGTKTIKAGYAAVVGMSPGTGELYLANFGGAQSLTNFGTLSQAGYRQNITILQTGEIQLAGTDNYSHFFNGANEDVYLRSGKNAGNVIINDIPGGKIGIGMNNPTRAVLEQNGSVGTTAAIFGGDGAGISLQKNWPVIGFNHYFDGSAHRSIGQGYSGVLGINQDNGNLYYGSWAYGAVPNASLASYVSRFNVTRLGSVGIGTESPESDLHIIQSNAVAGQMNTADGITLDAYYPPPGASGSNKWNMQVYLGQLFGTNESYSWLLFNRYTSWGWPWGTVAAIKQDDGAYYSLSDINAKKDIERLNKTDMLYLLLQLNPSKYRFKENKTECPKSFGFISQEVEKIFPNLVQEVNKNKLLNYSGFTPVIIAGIQEQQQQIEVLKNEVAELKKLILLKQ